MAGRAPGTALSRDSGTTPRDELVQIGQVAERTGLSLRTIRFYEENGLVVPTTRTEGGFRLYSAEDIDRLEVIKRMKPLGFSLEEMHDLLDVVHQLGRTTDAGHRRELVDRLRVFRTAATTRVQALRAQLAVAEGFAASLEDHLTSRS